MTSKSEQRLLTQQGQGRLCCICIEPINDAAAWVHSGLPVKYLCCPAHVPQAKARALNDPTLKVSPP